MSLAYLFYVLGGESIQRECFDYIRNNGKLMEGQVFTSSAGTLKCKKIIHAVGPVWRGGNNREEQTLYACIDNCFDEAQNHRLKSIAIPPISTGIFGYPLEQAIRTVVEALYDREKGSDPLPAKVIFVDNKQNSLRMFRDELNGKFRKVQQKAAPPTRPRIKPPNTPGKCCTV